LVKIVTSWHVECYR